MKNIFALILFTVLTTVMLYHASLAQDKNGDTGDVSQMFLTANQAYKEGKFEKAAALYEKLIARDIVNGNIFYNLGNAYLKAGKIGKALVTYRRAELFLPRDEDLQANIQHTLQLTTDKIEGREPYSFLKSFCFWHSKLTMRELIILCLMVNVLLWGIAIVRLFYNWEYLWLALYASIFCALLLGISSGIKIYSFYLTPGGVVTAQEITVRSGGSPSDTVLFQLHEGAEFEWLDENEGWIKIRLRDGKKGWVQKETVEKVEAD